jgi:hypothetical protein
VANAPFLGRAGQALGAFLILGAMACAGVEGRFAASPVDTQGRVLSARTTASGLAISGGELRSYGSAYFGLVEVVFENTSADWIHISRLDLDFIDPAKNAAVLIPRGAELEAWHSATLQRNDIRETNHATTLGALFAIGETVAVAGAVSGEREIAAAGGAVALGASTAALVADQDRRVQRAERVRVVPGSHLLATPFGVPPGLFTKKWVLLQTRSHSAPCVSAMLVDYDVEGRGRERALVRFRAELERSEWQYRACRPPF